MKEAKGTQNKMKLIIISSLLLLLLACQKEYDGRFDDQVDKEEFVLILDKSNKNHIPDEIGKLVNLKKLTISKSKEGWVILPPFSAWNKRIDNLPTNALTDEIIKLKKLRVLNLSYLDLTALPEGFGELKNLDSVNLSVNGLNISNEMEKLKQLKKLKYLDILGNRLDTLEIKQWMQENPSLYIRYSLEQ